jgi:hypothetical protein
MGSVYHERVQEVLRPQAFVKPLDPLVGIFIYCLVEFETFEEWNTDPEIAVRAFSLLMSWLKLTVLFREQLVVFTVTLITWSFTYVCSLYIGKPVLIFVHTAGSSCRIYNAIDNWFTFRVWLHGLSFIVPTAYPLLMIL